jgi:hypothetical protein
VNERSFVHGKNLYVSIYRHIKSVVHLLFGAQFKTLTLIMHYFKTQPKVGSMKGLKCHQSGALALPYPQILSFFTGTTPENL